MSENVEPAGRSSTIRVVVLVVLLIAVITGGLIWRSLDRGPSEKFCTTALAFEEVHGRTVVDQDQGGPGKDGCDLPDHGTNTDVGPTLGFDCKVRDGSGKVIDSVPVRADGSCNTG